MRRGTWRRVIGVALAAWGLAAGAQDMRRPKRLIATGWDNPDQSALKEHIRAIEAQPFDGLMITVTGRGDDGKPCPLRAAHSATLWRREWFREAVAELKSIRFERLTDNFVSIGANPGNVDWFDDAGWAAVAEHWAIAAWIAREAGFRGFLFDPEPYTEPYSQFAYAAQPGAAAHSFNEYHGKARERGRQVIAAVAQEFPEAVVYCYFMNSICSPAAGQADPRPVLAGMGYGLYPAFVDGWLDAAPPGMTFVDGCESAYLYHEDMQYVRAALGIKGACQELVSPENRARYRAQVQVSYGIYLDAYWNEEPSPWRVRCDGLPPVRKLLENVRSALQAGDGYVWVYGEQFRWWPTPNGSVKPQSWPEALPGCDGALRLARDPARFARDRTAHLHQAGTLANLARNGDFQSDRVEDPGSGKAADWQTGGAPAGWSTWQTGEDKGTFSWDRESGAAKVTGVVRGGCFIQRYEVAPGDTFLVQARVRTGGGTSAHMRLRWQSAAGQWLRENEDVMAAPGDAGPDGWRPIEAMATIPADVGALVLLLGVASQRSPEDTAWFDDVRVFKVAAGELFDRQPQRFPKVP
jgi:hypothetical protein